MDGFENFTTEGNVRFLDCHPKPADFFGEVIEGLGGEQKVIPPKFFYDQTGSQLFDAICRLEEYYPTRTEVKILRDNLDDVVATIGQYCYLIEPGSGSCDKVRLMLDSLRPSAYMPLDISKDHLLNACHRLCEDFPWLDVHAVCIDFTDDLTLPEPPKSLRRVAFFPGSSIGNFEPADAVTFLHDLGLAVGPGGGVLIGVDLKKDPEVLHAAYNDGEGVTAAFNKNLLTRINDELGADFEISAFDHKAFYNRADGRVEMHLESLAAQTVQIGDAAFKFAQGETIHTENSYKYTLLEFQRMAEWAGLHLVRSWTDPDQLFSIHFLDVR